MRLHLTMAVAMSVLAVPALAVAQEHLPASTAESAEAAPARVRQALEAICAPTLEGGDFERAAADAGAVRDVNPMLRMSRSSAYPATAWHWPDSPRIIVHRFTSVSNCMIDVFEDRSEPILELISQWAAANGGSASPGAPFQVRQETSRGLRQAPQTETITIKDARGLAIGLVTISNQRRIGPWISINLISGWAESAQ